jgi:hypothetical protein
MERYQLIYFFKDLINLSIEFPGKPGWGIGCSHLLETMLLRQEAFISGIIDSQGHTSKEYRLNGAGLKLHWWVDRDLKHENSMLSNPKFRCYISGDQIKDYADFIAKARNLIRERGYNHR